MRFAAPSAGSPRRATARLFARHAIVSLVAVVALGVALGFSISGEANQRGLSEGRAESKLVAQTAVEPLLQARPLSAQLGALERADLNRLVDRAVRTRDLLRLRLRDLAGLVVYSDDGSGFRLRPDDEALAAARGRIVARLTRLNADTNDNGSVGVAAVEVYQPLIVGGRVVGVLETYLPYGPIAAQVSASLHRLVFDLIVGLLVLWLALLAITTSVSRGLRSANRELAVARDEAVEASNMKSAFLANMSHEIRTPMNGILGMNELMAGTDLDEEQRGYAEQVAASGQQMLSLIDDVLDISRIETGRLDLKNADFDVRGLVERACASAEAEARSRGVAFEVTVSEALPMRLHGDGARIEQVLHNLVSNAVKFTHAGSVAVRLSSAAQAANVVTLRCEVADTGIGVATDVLEQMFQPFTQGDVSTTRRYGGTGLGLAIARELVELMGGTIGARSERGRGSTFWFEVGLLVGGASQLCAREVMDAAERLGSDAPLVLVAEDSVVNQVAAVRALERCGYRAEVVADGRDALSAMVTRSYAAVLMDCEMPGVDGYQAAAELRRSERGPKRTPLIAMTALAGRGDSESWRRAGMDDAVSKPLRAAELAEALRRSSAPGGPASKEASRDAPERRQATREAHAPTAHS
jgi:signal transduction histidine kinase/FixJ family two-component response regulator